MPEAAPAPTGAPAVQPASPTGGQSGTNPAAAAAAALQKAGGEAPPAPVGDESFEIVVAGEKQKRTRQDLIKAAQMEAFSQKAISDARTAHKALEKQKGALLSALTTARQGDPSALIEMLGVDKKAAVADPSVIIKALGGDPDAYARSLLSKKLEMEGMTPEQRRIAELEGKAAEAERRANQLSEQRRQERILQRAKLEQAQLFKDISSAAERVGLAADERALAAIHQVMEEMHRDGIPFVPDFIVQEAKERIDGTFKRLEEHTLKGLKGKALVDRLGAEVMKELRQHLISDKDFVREVRAMLAAKVRSGQKLDAPQQNQPPPPPQTSGKGYVAPTDFDEQVKQMGRRHGT